MKGMKKEISLSGKHALITGAGSGIGLGIAHELVDAGARVALVGRREQPRHIEPFGQLFL